MIYLIVKTTINNNVKETETLLAFQCPIKAEIARDSLAENYNAVLKEFPSSSIEISYKVQTFTLIEGIYEHQ